MAETLRGSLRLALSGFGFWAHDIGVRSILFLLLQARHRGVPLICHLFRRVLKELRLQHFTNDGANLVSYLPTLVYMAQAPTVPLAVWLGCLRRTSGLR